MKFYVRARCNAEETSLFWHFCPRKTLTRADETIPKQIKNCKDRITVMGCANVIGMKKCMIGYLVLLLF